MTGTIRDQGEPGDELDATMAEFDFASASTAGLATSSRPGAYNSELPSRSSNMPIVKLTPGYVTSISLAVPIILPEFLKAQKVSIWRILRSKVPACITSKHIQSLKFTYFPISVARRVTG
jgi:hypothetical protein